MPSRGGFSPGPSMPFMTYALLGANIAVFVLVALVLKDVSIVYDFGFVPRNFFADPWGGGKIPEALTIITSMFLHVDTLHIALNMFVLWMFGQSVEFRMGSIRFLIFYLLCGVAGAMAQAFSAPESVIPMIGASGAIFGALGAFALLFPNARVVFIFFPVPVRAIFLFPILIAVEAARGLMSTDGEAGIAFWAHVGGFVAGLILHRLFTVR